MKKKPKAKERPPFLKLGEVLTAYRKAMRPSMSQQALADKVGVHVQFVSNWERGKCAPPQHCHLKLAKVFRLPPNGEETCIERERIWGALMDDYGHDLNLKYGGLV